MKYALLIAVGLGYYLGLYLGCRLTKWIINQSEIKCARVCGWIFASLSLLPALYLGNVEGSNLGGIYGERLFESLGLSMVGLPIGIGLGIVMTIVTVICFSVLLGVVLGLLLDEFIAK